MWEKFNRVHNTKRASGRDIDLVTAVMVQSWTDIPTLTAMRGPTGTLTRLFMKDHARSGGGKGGSIKIKVPFNVLVGAEMWMNPRISEEI